MVPRTSGSAVRAVLAVVLGATLSGCALLGPSKWDANVSVSVKAPDADVKLVAGKTRMKLDGADYNDWLKITNPFTVTVPAAKDHTLALETPIEDAHYRFGKTPLTVQWSGSVELKTDGKTPNDAISVTMTLSPEAGAQDKKRDYISHELDGVPELVSKDEVLAAWAVVDGAATAAKSDGFQDLSARAEKAKQDLQPAYDATIQQQRALARVLQNATLGFGTKDDPTFFITFRDHQFTGFYASDRRVKFVLIQSALTATPKGGAIVAEAGHLMRGSEVTFYEDVTGTLDPSTGEFTGELTERNPGAATEKNYTVHGKLVTQ